MTRNVCCVTWSYDSHSVRAGASLSICWQQHAVLSNTSVSFETTEGGQDPTAEWHALCQQYSAAAQ